MVALVPLLQDCPVLGAGATSVAVSAVLNHMMFDDALFVLKDYVVWLRRRTFLLIFTSVAAFMVPPVSWYSVKHCTVLNLHGFMQLVGSYHHMIRHICFVLVHARRINTLGLNFKFSFSYGTSMDRDGVTYRLLCSYVGLLYCCLPTTSHR